MNRSRSARRALGVPALVISVILAGCGASSPSPSALATASSLPSTSEATPAQPTPTATAAASATSAATAVPSADEPTGSLPPFACVPSVTISKTTDRAQITDVRVGTHDGYDRVTFEFAGGIPQTVIAGVLPPFFADPSGLPLDVTGTAFLKVVMNGGTKVTPSGGVTYAGSTNFGPAYDRLLQLREGGDFEAVSTWYLGLDGGTCYRVMTLAGPSRLVIDVEH